MAKVRNKRAGEGEPTLKEKVIAELLMGDAPTDIALRHGIGRATVYRWKDEMTPEQLKQLTSLNGYIIDALLFDALESGLKSMKALGEILGDKEYIHRQNASDLAKLYDSVAERTIQILNAAERAAAFYGQATPAKN